jgi:hypothetical protein
MKRRDFVKAMLAAPAMLALPAPVAWPPIDYSKIVCVHSFNEASGVQHRLDVYSNDILLHWENKLLAHAWQRGELPHAYFDFRNDSALARCTVDASIRGTKYKDVKNYVCRERASLNGLLFRIV